MKPIDPFWTVLKTQGIAATAQALSTAEVERMTEEFGAHNYHPLPVSIVRGEGPFAFDRDGKSYIDCVGAYSALSHGHLSPFLVETLKDQLGRLALTSRAVYTPLLGLYLSGLCRYTDSEMACPMNTGAEAVETAIKVARKWAYTRKGVPEGMADIIVADGNFHGRTTTVVGFSSEPQYKRHFGPYAPGFTNVPFGDIAALEAAIAPHAAAVLLEPIQAEAGIILPPDGYLADVRKLCTKHDVLLIWDEIQTGFCRTGRKFAWRHEDAPPNLMCLGKALGGGLLPVSAVVGTREALGVLEPGDHGSTFGGNPLACAVGLAAMAELETKSLCERSRVLGERLIAGLRGLNHQDVKEIRGRGLLIGLEVREGTDTVRLTEAFLSEGLLTKETRHHTFRFAPALIIDEGLVDEIVGRVERSLDRAGAKRA